MFVVLVLFSTIRLFFPPFNDDLGTMPTRRPYSWKKSPSMVSVPLCTKLEMSDINSGNSGSPWASSIATLYHPPVGNEELRLSFLLAHNIANGEKRSVILLGVCASHLSCFAGMCLSLQVWRVFSPCLPLARKCGLPARAHSALLSRDGNLLWKGTLKEGLFCDDPQLHCGIRPGMASGLPWTRAKACAQILIK